MQVLMCIHVYDKWESSNLFSARTIFRMVLQFYIFLMAILPGSIILGGLKTSTSFGWLVRDVFFKIPMGYLSILKTGALQILVHFNSRKPSNLWTFKFAQV